MVMITRDRIAITPIRGPVSGVQSPGAPAFNLGVEPGQTGGQAPVLVGSGGATVKGVTSPGELDKLISREVGKRPLTGKPTPLLPALADVLGQTADNLLLAFIVGLTVLGAVLFVKGGRR